MRMAHLTVRPAGMRQTGVIGDGHCVIGDQAADQSFGFLGQIPQPVRRLHPDCAFDPFLILPLARSQLPAIATRCAKADAVRLNQCHVEPLLRQMQRRRQPSIPAADDAHIGPRLAFQGRERGQRGGCCGIVRCRILPGPIIDV